jgi:phosphatidylinositol-4,5-bisphosphate 3-kinase
VAKELKEVPKDERTKVLQAKLRLLELPSSFLLPYNPKYARIPSSCFTLGALLVHALTSTPLSYSSFCSFVVPLPRSRFEVARLIVEKCRVMDSMTSPLWLVFENSERQTAHIIFKVGDDLRTDILSLQMIRIMDQLWRNEGLDLHMQPYRAVSTGKDEGIIEVVTNSETTSAISQAYGGGGAVSAFSRTALAEWLRACNPTEAAYREAVTNFTLSCAGYCVATYILGVGDRHNDNIMITYGGNLFHIDFAYFLGRRVTFAGIPRETTPFVLTPAFVQAMGGLDSANFRSFVSHCCRAYNVIRRHGHLFITLFAMMVSSGMSQLQSLDDLDYLRRALALDLTDEEAAARFTQLIQESCSNQITQFNNAVHIFAHS